MTDLHKDGVHLAVLFKGDVVGLVGGDGAAAADFGVYRSRGNGLGGNLRQGAEQECVREKGEHQHNAQEDYRGVLDPFSFFNFFFCHSNYPFTEP